MDNVTYDEFRKLDLRVVRVVNAERIPAKDNIVKLTVEFSAGQLRTLIAGGAQYYPPNHYIGKKLVALLNLEPKRIAGVESQGMALAAEDEGKPVWLIPESDVPVGSRVK